MWRVIFNEDRIFFTKFLGSLWRKWNMTEINFRYFICLFNDFGWCGLLIILLNIEYPFLSGSYGISHFSILVLDLRFINCRIGFIEIRLFIVWDWFILRGQLSLRRVILRLNLRFFRSFNCLWRLSQGETFDNLNLIK